MREIIYFTVTVMTMLSIDAVWLAKIAPRFYQRHIGHLLAPKPSWFAAVGFYIAYTAGLLAFVIVPAMDGDWSWQRTFFVGAGLGAFAYGTYDLTNQATMKRWPEIVTFVDVIWGTLLTGASCTMATIILRWLEGINGSAF